MTPRPAAAAGRAVGAILLLAAAAVAVAGGVRLNRAYPDAAAVFADAAAEGTVVVDARGPLAYRSGHVPGARNLYSRELLGYDPVPGVLAPPAEIGPRLDAIGLTPGSAAVVYDEGDGSGAPLVVLVLRAFGVDARLLRGGYAGWLALGGAAESGPAAAAPAGVGGTWTFDDTFLVDSAEVGARLRANLVAPVDARAPAQYAGEHLEGAVSLPAGRVIPAGTLPRYSEMAEQLAAARVTPATHVLLYGASLAEAAQAWIALAAFGHARFHVVAGPFEVLRAAGLPLTAVPADRAASIESNSMCWGLAPGA